MNFLISLVTLAVVCIQQATAATLAANMLNWTPGANITRFESTLIVPPTVSINPSQEIIQVWPSVGPADGSAVLLNHITNQHGTGTWNFESWLLPGTTPLSTTIPIYGGQAMTSIFAKDVTNGQWLSAWIVESGTAPNVASYAGSLQMDPAKSSANKAYQIARLVVEFQYSTTWNIGTVSWQNIIIVAETTSTTWCTNPTATWKNFVWSAPIATVDGAYTTCYVNSVTMYGS